MTSRTTLITGQLNSKDNKASRPTDILSLLWAAPAQSKAVIVPDLNLSVTYESLRNQVMKMVEGLAGNGVSSGTRVATALNNGLAAVVAFLAASIAGVAAPLNPAYRYDECFFYLKDLPASLLLCPSEGMGEAKRAAQDLGIPVSLVEMDHHGFVQLKDDRKRPYEPAPSADDLALVLHTSGSTGRPKRVALTHRNLSSSCVNIVNTYSLSPEDTTVCVMPLYHIHGLVASTLSTFLAGGTVIIPQKLDLSTFWHIIATHRVSWYSSVPTFHQFAITGLNPANQQSGRDSLRFVRSCSAALSPQLMQKIENRIGVPALEAYGMTEASHQICSNPLPPAPRKPGTVGTASGTALGIVDAAGNHLAANEVGEVVLQGETIISKYENAEANVAAFSNGWFRTGDQGSIDSDGYLKLTGRLKELINRGGEKLAPLEIDEVLLSHPAVSEAATFGVPHPSLGEEVAAAVVLREPIPVVELLKYCRDHLAEFKCPKKIFVADSLPRTPTGKIQRQSLSNAFSNKK